MPSSKRSLAITDAYRARFAQTNQAAGDSIGRAFVALVRIEDLHGGFDRFATFAGAQIDTSKAQQVVLADKYFAAYGSSELGRRVKPTGLDPQTFGGEDRFSRPTKESLTPALFTVKMGLLQGLAVSTAVALGATRASRISAADVASAGRTALDLVMKLSPARTVGWQRVAGDDACGACLGAATGAIRADDEIPEAHNSCQCTAEPVFADAANDVDRLTGDEVFAAKSEAEQNALFAGRGGVEKAQLIRDGMPLSALVQTEHPALGLQTITETALSKLTA